MSNKNNFDNLDTLVVSGGGIKSIAALGSLKVLEEKGILKNIKKYAGTSAGGIIVSLLVIGYTPDEINELIFSKIGSYTNESLYKIPCNMIYNYGIYSGDKMISFLEGFFEKKSYSKKITFKELYERTNKILVMTGTSLSIRDTIFFNYQTTPNLEVIKAIRITASIPLYFTSVRYLHEEKEHLMCDGGVLSNFPLYYFDYFKTITTTDGINGGINKDLDENEEKFKLKVNKIQENVNERISTEKILYSSFNELYRNKNKISKIKIKNVRNKDIQYNVIGILLLGENENRDTEKFFTGFNVISNLKEYITCFLETLLKKIEQDNFLNPLTGTKANFFDKTITIITPPEISIIKFNLTKKENDKLIHTGIQSTIEFFS